MLYLECGERTSLVWFCFNQTRFNEANLTFPACKMRDKDKFTSFKFNAKFIDGANIEPSNLQSRTDQNEPRHGQIL